MNSFGYIQTRQADITQKHTEVESDRTEVASHRQDVIDRQDDVIARQQAVDSAAAQHISDLQTESNTQVARVQSEGDTQDARVQSEGDTQVARVQSEGDTQVGAATTQASNAANSATLAGQHKDTAVSEAVAAANSATLAEQHKDTAVSEASAAANSATLAGQHKDTAVSEASDAANSATLAGQHRDAINPDNFYLKTEVDQQLNDLDALPDQTGQADKALFTDGTNAAWQYIPEGLPEQTGNAGKALFSDGTNASWTKMPVYGRRNLLMNGAFNLWQRGTSLDSGGYLADRWLFLAAQTDVRQDLSTDCPSGFDKSIKLTSNADNWMLLRHRIESAQTYLEGKTVTLSFWAKASQATELSLGINDVHPEINQPISTEWSRYSVVFVVPPHANPTYGQGHVNIDIRATMLGSVYFTGIQLELGDTATAFEYVHPVNELARCQRYFTRLDFSVRRLSNSFAGSIYLFQHVDLPVPMRAIPSIVAEGDVNDGAKFTNWDGIFPVKHSVSFKKLIGAGQHLDLNRLEADAEL